MKFLVTFTSSANYIKNPHLRGKLIDVLGLLTTKCLKKSKLELPQDPFLLPLAEKYLGPALINYYIEIETTGASTQFYDKFNGRFYVQLVLRHIWKIPSYRESFTQVFRNEELFLRFINMVMNDTIYLLDESFAKLHKIHEIEELANSPQWAQMPIHRQQERTTERDQTERVTRTYLILSKEIVRMFKYITKDMHNFFIRGEVIDRIAAMLNYSLAQMAGPKSDHLKIAYPERAQFNPTWFLRTTILTYLNFTQYDEFLLAVVKDGRSYHINTFRNALSKFGEDKKSTEERIQNFSQFIDKLATKEKEEATKQETLGEIPDEYLDPILQTLMTDPVKLPTSNVVVDRATITRHLLSTNTDPFNREHLTFDMLIPDVELKEKIDKFLAQKK